MKVKIDTKEKFHVITLMEPILSAKIAADLTKLSTDLLQQKIINIVLNLADTDSLENEIAAESLVQLQQKFYESNASFVICNMPLLMEEQLEKMELLEIMNVTPTESEAWDIVQMEEIERELMDDEGEEL